MEAAAIHGSAGVNGAVPWPAGFEPWPRDAIESSIPARFAEIARRHPAKPAVIAPSGSLTYGQLAAAAARIADAVHASAHARARTGVVLCEQRPTLVAAILGVLTAGRAYVPLDPTFPERRLARTIERSGADVIVADAATSALARRLAGPNRQVIDADDPPTTPAGAAQRPLPAPDDVAYVYFTSGSTGEPKGVFDNHRNVLHNILRYTNSLGLHAGDRLTLLQRPAFSGAVSSLFGALLNGGTSCLFDLNAEGPSALRRWLADAGVTVHHSVPSIFRLIAPAAAAYPAMRVVRLEGDRASRLDLELFARHFDEACVLVNGLGATECGLVRQFPFRHGDVVPDSVPIGFPVVDMQVFVADGQGREAGVGAAGEIVVRSAYLALGYWDDPANTAARFRSAGGTLRDYRTGDLGRLRADGCLEHLGRVDLQPRLRGAVVEVEAIERALLATAGVAQVAVAVRAGADGQERLLACVVPAGGASLSPAGLRAAVAAEVPPASVPDEVVVLDALPLGENGKVDLRRLPDVPRPASPRAADPPGTPLETAIAEVWAEVLRCGPVARDDDFRALGGDSLAAAEVLAEIRRRLGVEVQDAALADAPTVAALAAAIDRAAGRVVASPVERVRTGGAAPPMVFCTGDVVGTGRTGQRLARVLPGDRTIVAVAPFDPLREATPATLEAMAAVRLRQLSGLLPEGPCHLVGYCGPGGLLALEMARQLEKAGRTVLTIVLIDTIPVLPPGTGPGLAAAAKRVADRALRVLPPLRRRVLVARWRARLPASFHDLPHAPTYGAYFAARAVYQPGPVRAPIHVLWPEDDRDHPSQEQFRAGWRRVAAAVRVTSVPGDHLTVLGVHIGSIARALDTVLEATAGDSTQLPRQAGNADQRAGKER